MTHHSMLSFGKASSALLFLVFCLLCPGCKNESGSLGLNLKGNEYLGNAFTDSLQVTAYSIPDDSVATNRLNNVVLGETTDPVFGKTACSFFTRFALASFGSHFGEMVVLDSAVLTLAITGYYGDTNALLQVDARELSESILDNTTYYNSNTLSTLSGDILENGSALVKAAPNTKVSIDTAFLAPHLRLRLAQDFGYKLLHNTHNTSDNDFQEFFKGLEISASALSPSGCLLYLNLNSSISSITLYYRENEEENQTKRHIIHAAGQNNFSHFEHDFSTSRDPGFQEQVVQGNPALGEELLYAQPLAGVETFITFPDLIQAFKGKKIVINRAELILRNADPDEEVFIAPESLSLTTRKNGQTSYILDDPNYSSSNTGSYFGGTYDKETHEYRFRITRHIQYLILNDSQDPGLYVNTRGSGIRGNRLIFKGTRPAMEPDQRLRLEIYYTTY